MALDFCLWWCVHVIGWKEEKHLIGYFCEFFRVHLYILRLFPLHSCTPHTTRTKMWNLTLSVTVCAYIFLIGQGFKNILVCAGLKLQTVNVTALKAKKNYCRSAIINITSEERWKLFSLKKGGQFLFELINHSASYRDGERCPVWLLWTLQPDPPATLNPTVN